MDSLFKAMIYVKFGAIGLLVLLLFFGGWYCGSLKSKAALDHSLEAQSATVTAALIAQRKISDAEEDRLNAVISKYEQSLLDPIALSVGTRVYEHAAASCPTVSSAKAATGRTSEPTAVPPHPDPVESILNAYVEACSKDASQLAAIQEAWPKDALAAQRKP